MRRNKKSKHIKVKGIAASHGFAIGPVYSLQPEQRVIQRKRIAPGEESKEIKRFQKALATSKRQIEGVQKKLLKRVGEYEARIFDAHILILEDPEIINAVVENINVEKTNAEYSYVRYMNSLIKKFDSVTDQYLKERVTDIRGVRSRVLDNFQSGTSKILPDTEFPVIIISKELPPHALGELNRSNSLGFVTELGGKTSHFSILARSLEIPALTGITYDEINVEEGDLAILDGNEGLLILNPTPKEIATYEAKKVTYANLGEKLLDARNLKSITRDGEKVKLSANIELPFEVDKVLHYGSEGIGLFRSEFLLLTNNGIPSENEQYGVYEEIVTRMQPKEVTIRTFDSGGDKLVPDLHHHHELNPFMGWRSIRVCLDNPILFKNQLRAILRASVHKNLKVMFPMVCDKNEFLAAKNLLNQVKKELRSQKVHFYNNIKVGCMIEVPSAALLAGELAEVSDFFSIGTNDLIQFTLAVDRGNERIANLFEPHHPAVLNLINFVISAAKNQGIPVSICGEMAGDPLSALLLIGMGVDELSMRPGSILEMRKFIQKITIKEAKKVWKKVTTLSSSVEINHFLLSEYDTLLNSLQLPQFQTYS